MLIRGQQFDPEAAAFAILRFHTHCPAHALHCAFHHGQAHARARILIDVMQSLEQTENPILILGPNADSAVLDL
jgi:hypothetical protein